MEVDDTHGNCESLNGRRLSSLRPYGSVLGDLEDTLEDSPAEYPFLTDLEEVLGELDGVIRICEDMMKKARASEGLGTSQLIVSQCSPENNEATKNASLSMEADTIAENKKEKFVAPVDFIDLTSEDSCDSTMDKEPPDDAMQIQSPLAVSMLPEVTTTCSPQEQRKSPHCSENQGCSSAPNWPADITVLSDDDEEDIIGNGVQQGQPENAEPGVTSDEVNDIHDENAVKNEHRENAEPGVVPSDEVDHEPLLLTEASETKVDDRFPAISEARGAEGDRDPLADVWARMGQAKLEHSAATGEPIAPPPEVAALHTNIKRRKVSNSDDLRKVNSDDLRKVTCGDDLSRREGYREFQWVNSEQDDNDLMQGKTTQEPISFPKPKRPRGRPRKDPGTSHLESRHEKSSKRGVNEMGEMENEDDVPPGQLFKKNKSKEPRKGDVDNKKGEAQEKEVGIDEKDEEDEQGGKPGAVEGGAELMKLSLNGEKVEYEPYVRRNQQEKEDDLEEVFNELRTVVKPYSDITTTQEGSGECEHRNFDFDEFMGYYCDDCGTVGLEMPTSEKAAGCTHKNHEYSDEAGIFCLDCGKVWRDIQSYYVACEDPKALRKPIKKVQENGDSISPQFQLNLQPGTDDFSGTNLELHPFFEEKLHPHQKKGFKFLTQNLLGGRQGVHESVGCVLAHAPGTGKTCLVISFIQSFLSKFPEGKPLILAPKIMMHTWEKEFEHWKVQDVPIFRISGSSTRDTAPREGGFEEDGGFEEEEEDEDAKLSPQVTNTLKEWRAMKLRDWQAGRGVLLMSYKLFANLVTNGQGDDVPSESLDFQMSKVLLEATNLVILDEGHVARNIRTQISQALLAMETKRRVLLSGTLFQNNFRELYTLLKLCRDDFMISHPQYGMRIAKFATNIPALKGNSAIRSKKEIMQIEERMFTEEIGDRLESYVKSKEDKTGEIESVVLKLQSLTASFVDYYPGEILKSLPGLLEFSIHLSLTESQRHALEHLPISSKHFMSRQCMALAACIHPCLVNRAERDAVLPFSELNPTAPSSLQNEARKGVKITFILQLMTHCKNSGEKLLIFCSRLSPLSYIQDLFCKVWEWLPGQQILRLDGTMSDPDKQKVIQLFNVDSQSLVLLASTKACKEGITLVGASRVVILDNPDNPSVVRQAVSRAFRIGQKRKVYVYRLITNSREEEGIFRRSVNKERLSQVLLDPISTMARLGGFLQEQNVLDIEDELLKKVMLDDTSRIINAVNRYNASG